jgi:hypothetical protein
MNMENINYNMTLLKQINKGTSMNSLEQFYIQLYAQDKKIGTRTKHGRIQPNIPTHFRDTETSHQHVTLTYLYPVLSHHS